MSFTVNIEQGITVIKMATNSSISTGENTQFGWSSHQKRNYIFNTNGIYTEMSHNFNMVMDNDEADMFVNQTNAMYGSTFQAD